MGITDYGKQLRPRENISVNYIDKVRNVVLSEASFADLFKRDNHTQFLKKIGEPLETVIILKKKSSTSTK